MGCASANLAAVVDGDHHRTVMIGAQVVYPAMLKPFHHLGVGVSEAVVPAGGGDGQGGPKVFKEVRGA